MPEEMIVSDYDRYNREILGDNREYKKGVAACRVSRVSE
jgi:hypothetical protein